MCCNSNPKKKVTTYFRMGVTAHWMGPKKNETGALQSERFWFWDATVLVWDGIVVKSMF
jgi:hypothetical protein